MKHELELDCYIRFAGDTEFRKRVNREDLRRNNRRKHKSEILMTKYTKKK